MTANTEVEGSPLDTVKLLSAVVLLIAAIGGFYYFEGGSVLLRVLGLLAVSGAAAALALTTARGQILWRFAQDSRTEVRKMVWPSRQETIQTTLIVFAMVLVMGILLWLFDMLLMTIVKALTGQGA